MRKFTFLFFLFLGFGFGLSAQTSCTDCIIDLPALPDDTLYISAAPDGQVGVFYEGMVSFRLPQTSTPVAATDSTVIPGIGLSGITIANVSNLPPGLSWEASQTEFDLPDETDGCGTICGTPVLPGLYLVEVQLDVNVSIITTTSTAIIPILIEPGQTQSDGFSITNTSGCGSVSASFTNNVPSNDVDGFSYSWDFGNGMTSDEENPGDVTYDQAGTYEVNYQAIIDTTGYFLTQVVVTDVACGDAFGGAPDLQLKIDNSMGEEVYSTDAVNNASLPLTFNIFFEVVEEQYTLRIMDDDNALGGGDDLCGSLNFGRGDEGEFVSGEMTVELTMLHPVDTVSSSASVTVYEQPALPTVNYPAETLCEGDMITVFSNYEGAHQWYRDSLPLADAMGPVLDIETSGEYYVTYTSADGCTAASPAAEVLFAPLPAAPIFTNTNNELILFDTMGLPASYALQWFVDGQELIGEGSFSYCAPDDGTYSLEVTDITSGCTNTYNLLVAYDPAYPGCISTTSIIDDLADLRLFPNPTEGPLQLGFEYEKGDYLQLQLLNTVGQVLHRQLLDSRAGQFEWQYDLSTYPAGVYVIQLQSDYGVASLRVFKR